METLLSIVLLLVVVVLAWPRAIKKTLMSIMPLLFIAACIAGSVLLLQVVKGDKIVTITALNQRNNASEGSEVWISGVVIDGVEYAPKEILSEGWIEDEGYLKWRSSDQPFALSQSITMTVPDGADFDIVFDSGKSRGSARVQWNGLYSFVIDCYTSEQGTIHYSSGRSFAGLRISGKPLLVIIVGILAVLAGLFTLLKKKESELDGDVQTQTQKPRELWLDVLKVISGILIIVIHTVGSAFNETDIHSVKWIGFLVINVISRCAVPFFLMVSGALMLGKECPPEKTRQKVCKAVLLVFVWNAVYIVLQSVLWGSSESIARQLQSIPVKKGPSGHLWYLYFLVWLYLFEPVLGTIYRAMGERIKRYFLLITLIIPGLLDIYLKWFRIDGYQLLLSTQMGMTLTYIGILFAGRMIYESIATPEKGGIKALSFAGIGLGGMLAFTYFYARVYGQARDIFILETQLLTLMYSIGLFAWFASNRQKFDYIPSQIAALFMKLSKMSLGVYVIHCAIRWMLGEIAVFSFVLRSGDGIIDVLLLIPIYYLISVLCVGLMTKIPLVRRLV